MEIVLREVELKDGEMIVKWRNSVYTKQHSFSKKDITLETNKNFFENYIATGKYKQYIVESFDEQYGVYSYPIATIYLKDMDYENHRCQLCIFTSDDSEWDDKGKEIGTQKLIQKAFDEFGMHKVYTYVFSGEDKEMELLLRAGFRKEAVLYNEVLNEDGSYGDVYRLSVINE